VARPQALDAEELRYDVASRRALPQVSFVEEFGGPAWEHASVVHTVVVSELDLEPLLWLFVAEPTAAQRESVRLWRAEPEAQPIVYGLRPDLAPEQRVARLGWICMAAEAKCRGDPKPPASELAAAVAEGKQPAVRRLLVAGCEIDATVGRRAPAGLPTHPPASALAASCRNP